MLRAKVGLKIIRSIRPVTEAEQEPRLCAATLVRWIQQVRRQLLGRDCRADSIRNRHGFAAVYQPTDAWRGDLDENGRSTISTPPVASTSQAARNWLHTAAVASANDVIRSNAAFANDSSLASAANCITVTSDKLEDIFSALSTSSSL